MLILSDLTFSNLAASVETLQGGGEAIQSPSVLNLVLFKGGKRGIEKQEGNRRNLIWKSRNSGQRKMVAYTEEEMSTSLSYPFLQIPFIDGEEDEEEEEDNIEDIELESCDRLKEKKK